MERERLRQFPAPRLIPFTAPRPTVDEARARVQARLASARERRSVRHFSTDPVPLDVLQGLVAIAAQAPSGANRQPWRFVIVLDAAIKRAIREAAENEERESYDHRMPDEWLAALAPLGVDWRKPFLEDAPALIVMFRKDREVLRPDAVHAQDERAPGEVLKAYYSQESCGIAAGMLIAAIHEAGLVTLTHTPSPMGFLARILGAEEGEKPFLLLPVGFRAEHCAVPDVHRKPFEQVCSVR